jgi:hypothetical protein
LVGRWFRELTDKRVRRGFFNSVDDLGNKIYSFIDYHNDKTKAYHWLAKVERARVAIATAKSQARESAILRVSEFSFQDTSHQVKNNVSATGKFAELLI